MPGTIELAHSCVDALGQKSNACLLQSHGAVCVGGDMAGALTVAKVLARTPGLFSPTPAMRRSSFPLSQENTPATRALVPHPYGQPK